MRPRRFEDLNDLADFLLWMQAQKIAELGMALNDTEYLRILNEGRPVNDQIKQASWSHWVNRVRMPDLNNSRILLELYGPVILPFLGLKLGPMFDQFLKHANDAPPERVELALRILRGEIEEENFSGELARVTA